MDITPQSFLRLVNRYRNQQMINYLSTELVKEFGSQDLAAIFFDHRDHHFLQVVSSNIYEEMKEIWETVDNAQSLATTGSRALVKDPKQEIAQLVRQNPAPGEDLLRAIFNCDQDQIQEYMYTQTSYGPLGAILGIVYLESCSNFQRRNGDNFEVTPDIAAAFGLDVPEFAQLLQELPAVEEMNNLDTELEDIFLDTKAEIAEVSQDDEDF